jgi:hypothetical protein
MPPNVCILLYCMLIVLNGAMLAVTWGLLRQHRLLAQAATTLAASQQQLALAQQHLAASVSIIAEVLHTEGSLPRWPVLFTSVHDGTEEASHD